MPNLIHSVCLFTLLTSEVNLCKDTFLYMYLDFKEKIKRCILLRLTFVVLKDLLVSYDGFPYARFSRVSFYQQLIISR